ncbi:MAG TPA: sigma-54 dependent transcriptional regulator [Spirochaetia bacterium]|nr:sigma-54 dependent transcriptional regulator [Spirochaetia bacterium]
MKSPSANPTPRTAHILVVDDEKEMCTSLRKLLGDRGFTVSTALSAKEAFQVLQRRSAELILCDIAMPDMSGLMFLSKVSPQVPVIMMTAFASIETSRRAFKLGARDYLVKPFDFNELLVVVNQNLEASQQQGAGAAVPHLLESGNGEFRAMVTLARKFSQTDMPVLLTGESGAGKEVIARYIYGHSARRARPMISINCASIPESLLESELFGHEKGAFTGAISTKVGRFEEADGGTLFLDEIGDMPAAVQAKMLRALEEFSFTRLGGKESIRVDLRVIAATNQPIDSLITGGRFRLDLFHRLNGLSLWIPPLRERPEDLEALARHFVGQFCEKYGKPVKGLDPGTLDVLRRHSWPGNVRELKNCMERAVVVCDLPLLMPDHLPDSLRSAQRTGTVPPVAEPSTAPPGVDYRTAYMRKIILDALERTGGNREEAAQLLKISRKTLYNRMKDLGIRHDFT